MSNPAPVLSELVSLLNIKGFGTMPPAHVEDDVEKLAALQPSLVGWCEGGWIDRYVRSIWEHMPPGDGPGPDWSHSFVPGNSAGLSYDQDIWQPVDSADYLLLHPAKKGVSDERHYLAQDLRHRGSGQLVRGIVAHYAPKRGGLGVALQREGNRVLRGELQRTLRRGVPVILMGDFNQRGKPLGADVAGRPLRHCSGDKGGGIDKIICVAPDGYDFVLAKAERRVVKGFHSDHDAVLTRPLLQRVPR